MIVEFYGDRQIEYYKDLKQLEDRLVDSLWIHTNGKKMNPLRGKNLLKYYQKYNIGHYFLTISLTTLISNEYRKDRLENKASGHDVWHTIRGYGSLVTKVRETGILEPFENSALTRY
ncbi:MAG: hypothetical protein LBL39_00970 [Planctomycetaceae bacterium]|nr:hypothetical protein [Planctomycetaceae bacterium]